MDVNKAKIGWGILGPGRIAHQFCDCLLELDDAAVAAVGSRSLERSQALASIYGANAYGSYEEMLADPAVDIVYVATPHNLHERHAILAAEAGKAVLCEKPFAVNRQQAERMFAAAKANSVFMMEGLWSRFFPAWRYVREQLDSGRFGQVEQIFCATQWGGNRDPARINYNDRIHRLDLAGGVLLDAGIYSLAAMTLARGRLDMPVEMHCMTAFEPSGVDGDDDMMLRFADGMVAFLSCSLHRGDMECKLICERGVVRIPVNRNPDRLVIQERRPYKPAPPKPVPVQRPMRDYYTNLNDLPVSERRMGGQDTLVMDFPYRRAGFQFEAEAVQDCLRRGLQTCPDATPEETLLLLSIADEVRRRANYRYPFEA